MCKIEVQPEIIEKIEAGGGEIIRINHISSQQLNALFRTAVTPQGEEEIQINHIWILNFHRHGFPHIHINCNGGIILQLQAYYMNEKDADDEESYNRDMENLWAALKSHFNTK